MIKAVSADGTGVRAFDEGSGPVIVVVHPGLDDGRSWGKVAARLSGRFRVVRIVRRHYRLDLPVPAAYSIAAEVDDVLALAKAIGEPMVIVGHSSGGVVALEVLAASPGTFAGAGKPVQAMRIFSRDVVGMPAFAAWLVRPVVAVTPKMRALAPRQLTDLDGVGLRLASYARITIPVVLLGGERSPAQNLADEVLRPEPEEDHQEGTE